MNQVQSRPAGRRQQTILSHVSVAWLRFGETVALLEFFACVAFGLLCLFGSHHGEGILSSILVALGAVMSFSFYMLCKAVRAVVEHLKRNG